MNKLIIKQSGFTIIELMIATVIFTMVLLVCSYAIVHVGKVYYKGVITNRTQDLSRKVLEDVTQVVQFGPSVSTTTNPRVQDYTNAFGQTVRVYSHCIGSTRYSYVTDRAMGAGADQTTHLLWRDVTNDQVACVPANLTLGTPSADGIELLGETMRLPRFNVVFVNGIWSINIRVAFGTTLDLFENDGAEITAGRGTFEICKGVNASGQFCAVSDINTNIQRRI